MIKSGTSGEPAAEEGLYICEDGCEHRQYREGEEFLPCAMHGGSTRWVKVEEI